MTSHQHLQPGRRALLAGACGVLVLAGCGAAGSGPEPVASVSRSASDYVAGTDVTGVWTLPDLTLTDQRGRGFNLRADTTTKATLVFFGYSNCPDVCTGILADLATALQRGDAAVRAATRIVLVSTDPARDTPAVLTEYLARIDPDIIGLTGPIADINKVATALGVPIEDAKPLPGGGHETPHGTQVIGFGADDASAVVWTDGTTIANYRADIATLVRKQN